MGICTIGDLYLNRTFASFSQLCDKFQLPRNNLFRFMQIRDYVRTHLPSYVSASPSLLDRCLLQNTGANRKVSHFYESLLTLQPPSMSAIKSSWENEFGAQIPEATWQQSLDEINNCSINSRHCLIQFRVLHRLHYTKLKLHKLFPNVSPQCDKCNIDEATHLHSFLVHVLNLTLC